MAQYPKYEDYEEALADPVEAFLHPDLNGMTIQKVPNSIPQYSVKAGQSCTAHLVDTDGSSWILKMFFHEDSERERRYIAIENGELQECQSSKQYFLPVRYLTDAIDVEGQTLPCLLIRKSEGRSLKEVVREAVADKNKKRINDIIQRVLELSRNLYRDGVVHGDIHFENIFCLPDGSIELIDYDDVYIVGRLEIISKVLGAENFVHPLRKDMPFAMGVDNFSFWILVAQMYLLIADLSLWDVHKGDQTFLFEAVDFRNPTDSAIFQRLQNNPNREVQVWLAVIINDLLASQNPNMIPLCDRPHQLCGKYRDQSNWPAKIMYDPFQREWMELKKN